VNAPRAEGVWQRCHNATLGESCCSQHAHNVEYMAVLPYARLDGSVLGDRFEALALETIPGSLIPASAEAQHRKASGG